MENLSYSSYPDSANSSPHSRDVDETQSFDEPPSSNTNIHNYKVKFMCSYGGKIQPRSHDNQLSYVGGDTKILAVERNIKFSLFISKVTSLCNADADHVCFKYQLPGEDLDALISVTNDEDLEHMMLEYDRLYRASAKPARLRLFLFHLNPSTSFGSDDVKSERQWFVDALNSVPVQNLEAAPPPPHPSAVVSAGNADFLFGSEKIFSAPPMTAQEIPGSGENQQMPDLQALRIAATDEQDLIRKFEEANSRVYDVEHYQQQKVVGRIASPPPGAQVGMPVMMQVPAPFLQERHFIPGNEQTLYQIPYHQTPTLRPVTGQVGQGYYGIQQPVYNMVPAAVASLPQQQTQKVGVYCEGIGMMQQKVGNAEQGGYLQVGYHSGGRQVYYSTTQQYQTMAMAAPATVPMVGLDNRQGGSGGGALTQDGRVQVVGGANNVMLPQTSSG